MKFFHSEMPGAPALTGTAGSGVDLLDALLVYGWGNKTVSALVVSSGVATATVSASPNPAVVGSTIVVSGATPSALNGEQVVTAVGALTVSFATSVSDQTATGSISFKMAGLGWTVLYTDTNKRVYKRTSPEATTQVLVVDDTAATYMRVLGYESMSDASTGVGRFPTTSQLATPLIWGKSDSASGSSRKWALFGDARSMYYSVSLASRSRAFYTTHFFGDIVPQRAGDAYACMITGARTDITASNALPGGEICLTNKPTSTYEVGCFMARPSSGLGSAQVSYVMGQDHTYPGSLTYSGSIQYGLVTYPNAADNSLLLCRVSVLNGTSLRGTMPGLWHCPQDIRGIFDPLQRIAGSGDITGRTAMAVPAGASLDTDPSGCAFYDITGPWR